MSCYFQTIPLFIYIRLGSAVMQSDLMDEYAEKIFGVACLVTQRTGYAYKAEILRRKDCKLETICSNAIEGFQRIVNICKKVLINFD